MVSDVLSVVPWIPSDVAVFLAYTKNGGCSVRVDVGDARDKLSQLVQVVLDGEQVTICRNGEPVVDLVRTEHNRLDARKFGTLAGKGVIVDPNWHKGPETDAELEAWLERRFE